MSRIPPQRYALSTFSNPKLLLEVAAQWIRNRDMEKVRVEVRCLHSSQSVGHGSRILRTTAIFILYTAL